MQIFGPNALLDNFKLYFLRKTNHICFTSFLGWDYESQKPLDKSQIMEFMSKQALDYGYPKVNGEVLCHGNAISANKKPIQKMRVDLSFIRKDNRVFTKKINVFGDRYWLLEESGDWKITEPKAFESMPLNAANTFGGVGVQLSEKSAVPFFQSNLQGKGFDAKNKATAFYKTLSEQEGHSGYGAVDKEDFRVYLANIEDSNNTIQSINDQMEPVVLGADPGTSKEKAKLFGTVDDEFKDSAIRFPKDFKREFFQNASSKQIIDGDFKTGDSFTVRGMSESGAFECTVPPFVVRHFISKMPEDENFILDEANVSLDTCYLFPNHSVAIFAYRSDHEIKTAVIEKELLAFVSAFENSTDELRDLSHYHKYVKDVVIKSDNLLLMSDIALRPERSDKLVAEHKKIKEEEDEKIFGEFSDLSNKRLQHTAEQMNISAQDIKQHTKSSFSKLEKGSFESKMMSKMQNSLGVEALKDPFSIKGLMHLMPRPPTQRELLSGGFNFAEYSSKLKSSREKVMGLTKGLKSVSQDAMKDVEKRFNTKVVDQKAKKMTEEYLAFRAFVPLDKDNYLTHFSPDPENVIPMPESQFDSKNSLETMYLAQLDMPLSPPLIQEDKERLAYFITQKIEEENNISKINGSYASFKDVEWKNVFAVKAFFEFSVFENVKFIKCNFQNAVLRNSKFLNCEFESCIFYSTNLAYSSFEECVLKECLFHSSLLNFSTAVKTKFLACSLNKLTLSTMKHKDCDLQECVITDTSFLNCEFDRCSFEKTHFNNVTIMNAKMLSCFFSHVKIIKIVMMNVVAKSSYWSYSSFKQVIATSFENDFSFSTFYKSVFDNSELSSFSGSNLSYCDFGFSNMKGVNFSKCDLTATYFHHALLKEADFSETTTNFSDFSHANLCASVFKNLMLENVTFDYVNCHKSNWSLSKTDKDTCSFEDVDFIQVFNREKPISFKDQKITDTENDKQDI